MKLKTPIKDEVIETLKVGDLVYISGIIYTGRDQAHQLLIDALNRKEELPFDLDGQVIYYTGPTPAKPGEPIGSCGPTSSYRMDPYSPTLMAKGLKVMIGKGDRSDQFIKAMLEHKGVYLQAIGGAGALLKSKVVKSEVIAYHDLGPEAIHKLEVIDFPAIVTYDCHGGNLLKTEIDKYKKN